MRRLGVWKWQAERKVGSEVHLEMCQLGIGAADLVPVVPH